MSAGDVQSSSNLDATVSVPGQETANVSSSSQPTAVSATAPHRHAGSGLKICREYLFSTWLAFFFSTFVQNPAYINRVD